MWLLLALPFLGLLWVPFFNHTEPTFLGIPYFYWYQFAWVPLSSFVTWIAYRSRPHDRPDQPG